MCVSGSSTGPHLQRRFCLGVSWGDRDGSGDPHQDAAGTGLLCSSPVFPVPPFTRPCHLPIYPVPCVSPQVASRELGIPSSQIYISETSTGAVPNTCPSAASFGTDANGRAVQVRSLPVSHNIHFLSTPPLMCAWTLQDACRTLSWRLEPLRKKNPEGSWGSWVSHAHRTRPPDIPPMLCPRQVKQAFVEKISLSATGFHR